MLFTCMASLLIKRRRLLPGSHSRHAACTCRTRPQAEPHPDRKTEASRASRLLQWPTCNIRNITSPSNHHKHHDGLTEHHHPHHTDPSSPSPSPHPLLPPHTLSLLPTPSPSSPHPSLGEGVVDGGEGVVEMRIG